MSFRIVIPFGVLLCLLPLPSPAQSEGSLDPSFGTGGIVEISMGQMSSAHVAAQADGKVVVAGQAFSNDHFLARLLEDGSLDPSFGTGGITRSGILDETRIMVGLAIQSDGRILLAGRDFQFLSSHPTNGQHFVARFLPDGSLDPSFGGDGVAHAGILGVGAAGVAVDVTVQADGKVILGGYSGAGTYVARFTSDGTLDTTFDGDGIARHGLLDSPSAGVGVAVQADDKVLLAGFGAESNTGDFRENFIARFHPDGSRDLGFGPNGVRHTGVPSTSAIGVELLIQPDDRILLAAQEVASPAPQRNQNFITRFLPTGELDPSLDGDGTVHGGIRSGFPTHTLGMALQEDGKLLLSGTNNEFGTPGYQQYFLLRFEPDGSPDLSFGDGGVAGSTVSYLPAFTNHRLSRQPDEKILLVGITAGSDLFVARFLGNAQSVTEIPTLDPRILALLALLLAGIALQHLRA